MSFQMRLQTVRSDLFRHRRGDVFLPKRSWTSDSEPFGRLCLETIRLVLICAYTSAARRHSHTKSQIDNTSFGSTCLGFVRETLHPITMQNRVKHQPKGTPVNATPPRPLIELRSPSARSSPNLRSRYQGIQVSRTQGIKHPVRNCTCELEVPR